MAVWPYHARRCRFEHNSQADFQATETGAILQSASPGVLQFSEWTFAGQLLFLRRAGDDSYGSNQQLENQFTHMELFVSYRAFDWTVSNILGCALHDRCHRRLCSGVNLDCGDQICGNANCEEEKQESARWLTREPKPSVS